MLDGPFHCKVVVAFRNVATHISYFTTVCQHEAECVYRLDRSCGLWLSNYSYIGSRVKYDNIAITLTV